MSAGVHLALGCAPAGFAPLFPAEGEFAAAAPTLARLAAEGRLPDEARLHLFAYELVERVRDGVARGERRFAALLWPAALLEACGIEGHAWPELAELLPPEPCVSWHAPREAELGAELARLGLPTAPGYRAALERCAARAGWARRFFAPAGFAGTPERRTAAAFLVRDGRVLLERRAAEARVTPGVWDAPGGHVEAGEEPAATLARELHEELGLAVGAPRLVCTLDALEPPHGLRYRHDLFLVAAFTGEPRAREGQHLAWLTPRAALALADLNPPTGWALQELVERGELAPG